VVLLGGGHAYGNAAQLAIVDAGINLGWAVARTSVFPVGDPIQTPAIASALADAGNAMTTAEGMFFAPYAGARAQSGANGTPRMLSEYWQRYANEPSNIARTQYLHQAFLNYREGLAVTYDSRWGFRQGPTCDSRFFETAYYLARAQIAAALGPAYVNHERVELESMQRSIDAGLHTAIDGYPWSSGNVVRSDAPGDRRVCCSFGPPMAWDALRAMRAGTIGAAGYTAYRDTLRNHAFAAQTPTHYCRQASVSTLGATHTEKPVVCPGPDCPTPPIVEPPRPPVVPPPPVEPPRPPVQVACNTTQKQGGDRPEILDVAVGATRGNVSFHYDVMNIKDRIVVSYAGRVLHDTGCISGKNVVPLWLDGAATSVRVQVHPNCAGQKGTSWNFRLVCPR
jgi:hypothetical protein